MKKILMALVIAASLSGCATVCKPEIKPSVVVEYKYVAAPIPDEMLIVPDAVTPIDLSKASQRTVADWLARSEGRTKDMETKLQKIKKVQDDQRAKDAADQSNGK